MLLPYCNETNHFQGLQDPFDHAIMAINIILIFVLDVGFPSVKDEGGVSPDVWMVEGTRIILC